MHDGSSKDVEDIQIGDIVSSYNIPGQPEDTAGPFQLSNMWSWSTSSIENAELTSSVVTGSSTINFLPFMTCCFIFAPVTG